MELSPQAQIYRNLVDRLESIAEAEGTTTAGPDTSTPDLDYGKKPASSSSEIPTIEAGSFKEAYAKAVKMGVKKFRWCGTYVVKDKPNIVSPPVQYNQPAPYVSGAPTGGKRKPGKDQDIIPGTFNPDINTGGWSATYSR